MLCRARRTGIHVTDSSLDNEYEQTPISHAEYFVDLEDAYHNSDIVVPLTYNDPGMGKNFINGTVMS